MSSTTIERIVVRFSADLREWEHAVKTIDNSVKNMGRKMQALGASLTRNVTAPLTAFGGLAIREFAKMDNAITQSASIMSKDVERMGFDNLREELNKTAEQLSLEMPQSAEELGRSFYYLASAGFNAEESIGALPIVSKFATAGMFDMAKATDLVTDAQSALGTNSGNYLETMAEMERLAGNLVEANTLANASVEQFSVALTSKAATSMRMFNIEQEAGLAVLAAYADQGIKAELAGTAYDRVLRLLSKSALENKEAHEAFGLSVFDSEGNMRSMVDIISDLETGFQGLSMEEKVATLAALGFEARVQQSIFPLIGMSEQMREYEEVMVSMSNTLDEVSERQMKSFGNQLRIVRNHITLVARDVGRLLVPGFLRITEALKSGALYWMELDDSTKMTIINFAKLAAVTGPVLSVLGTMLVVLPGVAAGYKTLMLSAYGATGAMTAFRVAGQLIMKSLPFVGWILAAVSAFALIKKAYDELTEHYSQFMFGWEVAWNDMKHIVKNMIDNVVALFHGLWDAFGITVGYFAQHGPAMFAEFFVGVIKVLNKFKDVFTKFAFTLYKVFGAAFDLMWENLTKFVKAASSAILKLAIGFGQVFAKLSNLDFAGALETAENVVAGAIVGGYLEVKRVGEEVLDELTSVAEDVGADFMRNFNTGAQTERGGLMDAIAGAFDFTDPLANTTLGGPEVLPQSMDPFFDEWGAMMQPDFNDEMAAEVDERKNELAAPIVIPVSLGVDADSAYSTESFLKSFQQRQSAIAMRIQSQGPNKRDIKQGSLANRRELQKEDRAERQRLFGELLTGILGGLDNLGDNISGMLTGADIGGTAS